MNHKKSSLGRSRDLGMGSNGKGDADRTSDGSAYRSNYDEINWNPKQVNGFAGFQKLSFDDSESWDR